MVALLRLVVACLVLFFSFPLSLPSPIYAQSPADCVLTWFVTPDPGTSSEFGAILDSVHGSAPNDVWAVGFVYNADYVKSTLIEHWDGATWSVVPSPNGAASDSHLSDVIAFSPNDAWTVGNSPVYGESVPLVLKWDGVSWQPFQVPFPGTAERLLFISGSSSSDLWIGGTKIVGDDDSVPFLVHRSGKTWTEQWVDPNYHLLPIRSFASNDAWKMMQRFGETYLQRWDGSAWTDVSTLHVASGSPAAAVQDFLILAPDDIWAVGYLQAGL